MAVFEICLKHWVSSLYFETSLSAAEPVWTSSSSPSIIIIILYIIIIILLIIISIINIISIIIYSLSPVYQRERQP